MSIFGGTLGSGFLAQITDPVFAGFAPVTGFGLNVTGKLTGHVGVSRGADYAFNRDCPNVLPSPEVLMRLVEFLDQRDNFRSRDAVVCRQHLLNLGIQYGISVNSPLTTDLSGLWDLAAQMMGQYPSCLQLLQLFYQNRLGKDDIAKALAWAGDQSRFFRNSLERFRPFPDPTVMLQLYNRGFYDETDTLRRIQYQTGWNDKDTTNFGNLANIIPSASDIIRLVMRDVFNTELAQQLGLFDEFEENKDFRAWAEAQGLRSMALDLPGYGRVSADWPKLIWGAHWQPKSPTQSYDMFHRLRPDRVDRYRVGGIVPPPFLEKDLFATLKQSDYTKKDRLWLAAVAYRPIGLRDLRRMFMSGEFDQSELLNKFLDLGYNESDAKDLVKLMNKDLKDKQEREEAKRIESEFRRYNRAAENAYRAGIIQRDQYLFALVTHGMDTDAAEVRITAVDLEITTKTIQEYLKYVRSEFFLGLYNDAAAIEELVGHGITLTAANRMVGLWRRKMSKTRRIASTETIKKWYRMGLITENRAIVALRNLGWSNVENVLHVLETRELIASDILKDQIRQERDEERRQAKIKQAQREAEAKARQARVDFEKHSNKELMKLWLLKDIITPDDARERWNFMYPDGRGDFDEWLRGVYASQQ